MKVCHVITRLILGGAQENTLLTCQGLQDRGHEVTLITGPAIGREGQLLDRARAGGYRVVVLDEMRRAVNPLLDLRSYRGIHRLLAELSPDVMHSHSSKAGILARQAAWRLGGMKIVHTVHGLAFHPYQNPWLNHVYIALERRAARQSNAIISVADAMTRQALAAGIGTAGQYTTIYSGMEVEQFIQPTAAAGEFRRQLNLPADAVLVTQVSRLAPLKGHEFLLAAAGMIKKTNVYFCLVGDGELADQLRGQIDSMGLGGRFRLTGLLEPSRIPAVMQATDILVHCSLREGLARALPQAMLAGKPVISFDVDGAAEVVGPTTGRLIAPRDVAALAAAIDELADSQPLRQTLGAAGRELCRKRFDHNVMVDQIEAVYGRL